MKKKFKVKTTGLSKRGRPKTKFFHSNGLPIIDGITEKKMSIIEESLTDYKILLSRFVEIEKSPKELSVFLSLQRNPIFDITSIKKFKTGLRSTKARNCDKCEISNDHFIQRSKALLYVFRELKKNPDMDIIDYITVLTKYCSTVVLTKEEHKKVNVFAKQNPELTNVKIYDLLGIKIPGLLKWYKSRKISRAVEKAY